MQKKNDALEQDKRVGGNKKKKRRGEERGVN